MITAELRYRSGTRVSSADLWRNETNTNGDVIIAHGINSWPALLDQFNRPAKERTAVIEGDVFLYKQRKHRNRAIPLMKAPSEVTDRITFKEWLQEVTKLKKIMKINVKSTEVIRPVLQYLLAASNDISSPVVLHANIFRSPRSIEPVVDAQEFIEGTQNYYPDATISIGWTKNNITEIPLHHRTFGWREVFRLLSLIKNIQQAIMILLRLSLAVHSIEEITFLLGIRDTIAVVIWSNENDVIKDWTPLASLRSGIYSQRVLFDLDASHRNILHLLPAVSAQDNGQFDKNLWRTIEFPYASPTTSGIISSNEGVVFLGWQNAFLISLQTPPVFPTIQRVSSKLVFVKKRHYRDSDKNEKHGLVIYLVDKVVDVQSPNIEYGIKVFIGYKGQIAIENRDTINLEYQTKAIGQLQKENCYYFELIDRPRKLRNVIVSKTGDGGVDLLLQELKHSSSATKSVCIALLMILSIRILLFTY
uniref:Protein SERAC1 n=1 Tax=Syphacia muris TaxID=451379 RepID=A0A0N5AMB1_9BILA